MADDWTSLASQLASDTDAIFVVIANSDGDLLAQSGNLDHAEFSHLIAAHCATRDHIRRSYQSLDGMTIPQSTAQGNAHVFRHLPVDRTLVLIGKILTRTPELDNASFATLVYNSGHSLDESVFNAFLRFSVR